MKFGLEEPECGDGHGSADEQEDHEQAVTLIFRCRVIAGLSTQHDGDHPDKDKNDRQQEEETAHTGMVYRMRRRLNVAESRRRVSVNGNRGEGA